MGDGQTAKVANQIIVGLTIEAVSEALTFAQKAGADPARVRAALMGGFAASRILEVHAERMINETFAPGFRIRLHRKDLSLAVDAAKALDLALPNTAATQQLMNAAVARGDGDLDHSALIRTIKALAGDRARRRAPGSSPRRGAGVRVGGHAPFVRGDGLSAGPRPARERVAFDLAQQLDHAAHLVLGGQPPFLGRRLLRLADRPVRVEVGGDPGISVLSGGPQILEARLVRGGDRGKSWIWLCTTSSGRKYMTSEVSRSAGMDAVAALEVGVEPVGGAEARPAGLDHQHVGTHAQFARDNAMISSLPRAN